jgi:hypothetical protein
VSRQILNGEHAHVHDVPRAMKAAASHVLAEASAARNDLLTTAAHMAADARAGASSMRKHARRAAAYGSDAATEMMESGWDAGTRAWRDARRQAGEWGSVALAQARSRPAVVLVGVAVVGIAIGFWLRGASRRASVATTADASRKATAARARAAAAGGRTMGKANGRDASRRANSASAAHG